MADDGDALRARLHDEIEERSRACGHRPFACALPRLPGRSRCFAHVLDEPDAPFRRCRYANGGRRCAEPAPHLPKRRESGWSGLSGLCFEHARAALAARCRAAARRPPPPGPDALLLALRHHVAPERARTESCASRVSVVSDVADEERSLAPPDPFAEIDAAEVNASVGPSTLDCRSDSDEPSDGDEPRRACGVEEDSSGAEDTPYDSDPLRFAGVYSAEEVVRETGSALKRLQALYLGQLRALSRRLREARRTYLYALKTERETHCSISAQGAADDDERKQLASLKAAASYRRRHGADATLHRKLHEKRAKITEGAAAHRHAPLKCRFAEGGVKCPRTALPSARHCLRHVLDDKRQVLFRACGANRAGVVCQEPIPALYPAATCSLHADLGPYQTFAPKKFQSDSEESDS